jgi:Type IV secretory pathway, VirD4 components
MAHKSDFDKFYYFMVVTGVLILVVNLYYYAHPLWRSLGWTHEIADTFIFKLRSGGAFDGAWKTKAIAMALLAATLVTRYGKGRKSSWWLIAGVMAVGGVLYFIPVRKPDWFLFCTGAGAVLLCWAFGMIGRNLGHFNEAINDRAETFEQCRELKDTDDSINIPTLFQYRQKLRKGWINVVNPFRATLVLGTPGSGKSYSVYGPFIEQMIRKGYSMFVYDYKYPDLSEVVYNELERNKDRYKVLPEFCVINFQDPRYSLRCNPIDPKYIEDPADTSEIAELVMLNVNKAAVEKEDFFSMSAKLYLDAIIWFLRNYEDGKYCTFPHAIELMAQDYKKVFKILSREPELAAKIKPFQNALEGNAQDQLQGQIASAQIPLNKFVSKKLYWVLTGNDFTLDINDPEHPKILCVGNDPDRQSIYGTTLALYTSRMFKTINHKKKLKCGVLLDELPTIYLKGLDNLIATARSNKVAIVLGAQDKSQLRRDYGEKESDVIFNTVGNIFSGQVSGKTAEELSRTFGKEFRRRESQTRSIESDSVNVSFQQEELLPVSTIETLTQGVFFGKVADNNDEKIDDKFFCGEIQIDAEAMKAKRRDWKPMPVLTDFDEKKIREDVLSHPDREILEWWKKEIRRDGKVSYADDELEVKAREGMASMTPEGREKTLKEIADKKAAEAVDRKVLDNFNRIQMDIRRLVAKETGTPLPSQNITPVKSGDETENKAKEEKIVDPESDPALDPFN